MDGLASGLSLTPREVWSAIQNDPHWLDWQEGRISPLDLHLHLTKRLGASLTFEQFNELANRAWDPVPIHSDIFLARLASAYHIALLAKSAPTHNPNDA